MTTKTVNKLRAFTIISAIITSVLGVLGHFAFDFFEENTFIALFCPINESTWEHLKLLYFPMVLCLLFGYLLLRSHNSSSNRSSNKDHICASCYMLGAFLGILTGLLIIPIFFYTIQGIIGFNVDWVNIVIYFLAVIFGYIVFYQYATLPLSNTFAYHNRKNNSSILSTKSDNHCKNVPTWLSILGIMVLAILFFVFTFYTPHIGLFYDPVTQTFGL